MRRRIILLPEEVEEIENRLNEIKQALKERPGFIADPILTPEDVMRILNISRRLLQSYRDEGVIEFSAIKGKHFYRMSAINNMLTKYLKK